MSAYSNVRLPAASSTEYCTCDIFCADPFTCHRESLTKGHGLLHVVQTWQNCCSPVIAHALQQTRSERARGAITGLRSDAEGHCNVPGRRRRARRASRRRRR